MTPIPALSLRNTGWAARRWLMLLLLIGAPLLGAAQQQPARAYTFAASTGTYPTMPAINGLVLDIQQDNNDSRALPLGFTFLFEGRPYSQFTVSSEGWLSLGPGSAANVNSNNDLARISIPLLAPFWDDMNGDLGQGVYGTSGTAPNRQFTMEWRGWRWPNNAFVNGTNNNVVTISFQVKLFETTGVIQYCYRQEAGVPYPTTNLAATIGLAGAGGFVSLSDASAAPTASTSTSTNTLAQRPATGQIYTFTPPAPCPVPTGLTAVATSATTATVSFTPGGGSPTGYTLTYSPMGGSTGNTVVTAPASPVLLTGLVPNTPYVVSVTSTCGNGASSPSSTVTYFTTPSLPNTVATWTGAVGTAWDVAGNWSPAVVPTLTTNVILPAVANQPTVTGLQTCGALTLQAGATLTLATAAGTAPATRLSAVGAVLLTGGSTVVQAAGTTLAVGGTLTNNGATLTLAPTSTVVLDQVRPHSLTGTAATALQNLTLGSTAVGVRLDITAPLSVQRLLKTNQISLIQVLAGGSLRLLSNAQGTAQIVSDVAFFVGGPVTVERTLDGPAGTYAGLAHRTYAPPVSTGTMAGLTTPGFAPVVNAAYNTSTTPAAVTPFPTVFGYEQSRISTNVDGLADFEYGFYSPDALTDTLRPGLGYRLDAPGAAKLALTGDLTTDEVIVSGLTRATLPQSGYHLLGNPFASTLDWAAVAPTTTGLDAAIHVYQPAGLSAGTYQPYVNGVGTARYLLPGQAFLVRVTAASRPATVTFGNLARYPDYFDPATPPTAAPDTRPLVQLTLAGATGPTDAATAYFQTGATAGFDARFDAYKVPTGGVPYLAFAGTSPLAISGLPALGLTDVVLPLDVRVPAMGTYTLTAAQLLNLPTGMYAYLRDAQTGTATDLAQQPAVAFTMSAAFAGPRFSLVLTRTRILAVASAALRSQVTLYPNPAGEVLHVGLPPFSGVAHLTLTDLLGRTVQQAVAPATGGRLDVSQLPTGTYLLRVVLPNGATVGQKVQVQH